MAIPPRKVVVKHDNKLLTQGDKTQDRGGVEDKTQDNGGLEDKTEEIKDNTRVKEDKEN